MPNRKVALLAAAALAGALALTGCSSSSPSSSDAAAPAAAPGFGANGADKAAEPGGVAPPVGGAGAADSQSTTGNQPPTTADEDRSLIYTGTITVKVDSVSAMADRAIAAAIGAGGIVAGDNRVIDENRSQATLILRVPADRFNSTLDALAKLGEEESRQVQAQDVTDQIVDLDARVATQEASVSRVRDLLGRAQTIAEIVNLESELTRRQAELDSLKQRRAKLGGLVALATITAVLHAPEAAGAPEEPQTGFLAGLKNGWNGFLASVAIVLTVVGWLLPWAIAIGVPIWLVLWLLRRRRRPAPAARTAVPPAYAVPTPAPAPAATPPAAATPAAATPAAATPPAAPAPSADAEA